MKITQMCSVVVIVMVCVTSVVIADPVGMVLDETVIGPGEAVLFFVTHMGSLRDVELNPIIFNQVVLNQGSGYNTNSGVFTVPVAGVYQLSFSAQNCRGNHDNRWHMMVNDERRILCHAQVSDGDTALTTCLYMEELRKGDRVWMIQKQDSCAWASANSRTINFSGVLLFSKERAKLLHKYGSGCPLLNMKRSLVSNSGPSSFSLATLFIGLFLTSSELLIH